MKHPPDFVLCCIVGILIGGILAAFSPVVYRIKYVPRHAAPSVN